MAAINFTLNFGSGNNGLTLNGRLLDAAGTITGFVDLGDGLYSYQHTSVPNNHRGTFKVWVPASPALGSIGVAVNPEDTEDIVDILAYVQNIVNQQAAAAATPTSPSITTATTSNPLGEYMIEPSDFRMITATELVEELKSLICEPSLKQSYIETAIKSAINEDDHRPAIALTFGQTFTKEECDYPAPCSGARVIAVEAIGDCPTNDCYIPIWFQQKRNRIRVNYTFDGTGRITSIIPNRFITNKLTIALAVETSTEGLWQIYIEGQPEIPGSGIIRICGDPWVYAYKTGTTFASATIDSTDTFSSADGLPPPAETEDEFEVVILGEQGTTTVVEPSYGAPAPSGKHTCLYAQRISNCGRLADSELVTEMAGAVVEWPLIFNSGAYKEYLLALAISKAFTYLINSTRSDKDVQRFATLQDHWEKQAARLHGKIPKFMPGTSRRQFLHDPFRSSFSLRSRPSSTYDGGLARIGSLW